MKRSIKSILWATLLATPFTTNALTTINNPISGTDQVAGCLFALAPRFISLLVTFSGVFLLGAIIYGGGLWLTSRGNSESVEQGKKILVWSIIGMIIIASAYAIVKIMVDAINAGGEPFA